MDKANLYDYFLTENIITSIISKVVDSYGDFPEEDINAFKEITKSVLKENITECDEELRMCRKTKKLLEDLNGNLSELIVKHILLSINMYILNKQLDELDKE
jgi:hypothetical protein